MKKTKILLAAFAAGLIVSGCAGEKAAETEQSTASTEIAIVSESETEEASEKTSEASTDEAIDSSVQEEASSEADINESETSGGKYEDNFDVDSEAAAAFAEKVKAAVAEKDIDKLADLTSYPVYVGLPDLDGGAESRDEFIAIGADKLFTEELVSSVEAADVNELSPSMAGFVISDGSSANIIFSVVNGALAVTGINY